MLKLWGRTNSVNVQKVTWALAELGLPSDRVDAGLAYGRNREPGYLAKNPNGLVPLFEDGDIALWESNTIVRYLAARHDPGGLWPTEPGARARSEMWMDWQLSVLGPALGPLFRQLVRTPEKQRDSALVEAGAEACLRAFSILDRALGEAPYLAGGDFTMGDIPAGALTHRWYALDVEHGDYSSLRRWYGELCRRSAYRENVMLPLS